MSGEKDRHFNIIIYQANQISSFFNESEQTSFSHQMAVETATSLSSKKNKKKTIC